jgi:alpha-mannosidase
MKVTTKTFEELTSAAADFLTKKLSLTTATVHHYHCLWRKVKKYMNTHCTQHFDSTVGNKYLLHDLDNRDYSSLTKREKEALRNDGTKGTSVSKR